MPDTGWISLSNITSNSSLGGTAAWSNISRISASDNSRAEGYMAASATMYAVWGYGMSFGIPAGATIDGIEVAMEGYRSNTFPTTGSSTATIWLGRSSTTMVGTSYTINFNNISETVYTVGSSSDLWMDLDWTDSNIDDLYLVFQVASDGALARLYLDHVKIKIHYTESTLYDASVSPATASFAIPAITATYVYATTASLSPLTTTWAAVTPTAAFQSVWSATVSPTTASWSTPTLTATYEVAHSAGVSPLVCVSSVVTPIPTYISALSASVSPLTAAWSSSACSATYQSELTAAVVPLSASWSVPAVAETWLSEKTATVSPLVASWSLPEPVASYASAWSATVSPLAAAWTAVGVTALEGAYAFSDPLTVTWTIPTITATYVSLLTASVSPVSSAWTVVTNITPDFVIIIRLYWHDNGTSVVVNELTGYATVVTRTPSDAKLTVRNQLTGIAVVDL